MASSTSSSYPSMRRFIRIRNSMNIFCQSNTNFRRTLGFIISFLLLLSFAYIRDQHQIISDVSVIRKGETSYHEEISYVFQGYSKQNELGKRGNKKIRAMTVPGLGSSNVVLEIATSEQQRNFLKKHGGECYPADKSAVMRRYDELESGTHAQFQNELWKYCALTVYGGAYVDAESPLIEMFSHVISDRRRNYAVIGSAFKGTIHGSIIYLSKKRSDLATKMTSLIVETDRDKLDADPLLLQRTLYKLISGDLGIESSTLALKAGKMSGNNNEWTLFDQRCSPHKTSESKEGGKASNMLHCSLQNGYCCEIVEPNFLSVIQVTKHVTLPYQHIPESSKLSKPYIFRSKQLKESDYDSVFDGNLPYISTVREEIFPYPKNITDTKYHTPNFFEILQEKDCLPESVWCSSCLRNKSGADCNSCAKECSCYCKKLCNVFPEPKFVRKHFLIDPPLYRRDPSRLIPRIIHQTWFEPVTKEKYPNMSRLIESWKQSGWEYRFYDDNAAVEFLSTHFPPEVREAYESIIPGAFKADLFRYCALLINGGVYADMDVLLESNLDAVISDDVGFMTPIDAEPGKLVEKSMCLWNGFIASAPSHPFLARVIEFVVNNIRNRYTSVDTDSLLCPNPELSISHAFDTLHTAGPCIFGIAVNNVLMKHPQTPFLPGDINPFAKNNDIESILIRREDQRRLLPGRAIILHQNKHDMGAHRFTWLEENLVVAATDMPDYDDRKKLDDEEVEHYSKVHVKVGIYGLQNLYVNHNMANEELRLFVKGRNQ